jgi:2-polyprenyl-3-methyl-5-hydroxy-6-metoxy-1,4-benzoquinol methylase
MKIYKSKSDQVIISSQWYEPYLRNVTHLILKNVPKKGGFALDVGCGTGRISFALAEKSYKVLGVDINNNAIRLAKEIAQSEKIDIDFRLADFTKSGIVESQFYDLVVCSEVLEHTEKYPLLINNIYLALKPGGRLIISVPYDPTKYNVVDKYDGHLCRFTLEQIRYDLQKFKTLKIMVTGFPFHRIFTRLYLAQMKILSQEHSCENIWQKKSTRIIANMLYPFMRLDNFFAFTRLGDALIVIADK